MHSHESLPRAGALAWFARAAACGDAYAQFNLGMMYKDGDGAAGRYHFPARYVQTARDAVGDWALYRESRRNGGRPPALR